MDTRPEGVEALAGRGLPSGQAIRAFAAGAERFVEDGCDEHPHHGLRLMVRGDGDQLLRALLVGLSLRLSCLTK